MPAVESAQPKSPEQDKVYFMDRLFPRGTFRRVGAIALIPSSILAATLAGSIYVATNRLEASQQEGIGGVKSEVALAGENIQKPVLQGLDDANQALDEASGKLDFCKKLAAAAGFSIDGQVPTTTTTTVAAGPETQSAAPAIPPTSQPHP